MAGLSVPPAPGAVDVNCYLGRWAFRPVTCPTVDTLLAELDRAGIAIALVSPLDGVLYKEPMAANRELAAQVSAVPDRLWPVCTLNPAFPGWERDLDECINSLRARAIRLHPNYHNYVLSDPRAQDLARRSAAAGLPVLVAVGLEDVRMHHWLMQVPDVPAGDIARLAAAIPDACVIMTGATFAQVASLWRGGTPVPPNLYVELSRVQGPIGDIEQLCAHLGAEHMLFGTNLPLHEPAAPLLALHYADLPDAARQRIFRDNALALLGLRSS
jgi:predicted TIM-barrel fold metal-dependent hydrolase